MKSVCYAAGKSLECHPHTVNRPAALLPLLGKSVIEHNLACLVEHVDELTIIIGFEGQQIKDHIGDSFSGIPVKYQSVDPDKSLPDHFPHIFDMAGGQDFIFMLCESVFSPVDVSSIAGMPGSRLVKNQEPCCLIHLDSGHLSRIAKGIPLTDIASDLNRIESKDYWLPLKYPWHYLEANVDMVRRLQGQTILGTVEPGVSISGPVYIGEGTTIKANTCIEGPVFIDNNCTIGPFAYVRKDTIICKKVQIGRMEVFDSVLMSGFTSKHVSYAAHSVIGANGNFGAGTITADYRHDGGNHITLINGEKVNTGRRKLGAFIGDKVHTAIGTLIYPGRKMWPGTSTLPGEVVQKDKK